MKIGPLNTRCRVEQATAAQSSTDGSDITTWTLLGVRFCDIQDDMPSRSEAVRQGLETATNQSTIHFNFVRGQRNGTDITSAMRVVINWPTPQIYRLIAGPAIIGDKRRVEFKAERVSTDG